MTLQLAEKLAVQVVLKEHGFIRAVKLLKSSRLYTLLKKAPHRFVLKGHGFNRAEKSNGINIGFSR